MNKQVTFTCKSDRDFGYVSILATVQMLYNLRFVSIGQLLLMPLFWLYLIHAAFAPPAMAVSVTPPIIYSSVRGMRSQLVTSSHISAWTSRVTTRATWARYLQ